MKNKKLVYIIIVLLPLVIIFCVAYLIRFHKTEMLKNENNHILIGEERQIFNDSDCRVEVVKDTNYKTADDIEQPIKFKFIYEGTIDILEDAELLIARHKQSIESAESVGSIDENGEVVWNIPVIGGHRFTLISRSGTGSMFEFDLTVTPEVVGANIYLN